MKIALGQLNMVWEEKEASLQKVEKMMQQAAAGQADLIVFPEMSLTGFSMHIETIGENEQDAYTVHRMQELASRYGLAAGFGWAARPVDGAQKATNRFTLIGADGKILGEYKKLHPFRYGGEADVYEGGDRIVTVPFMGRQIALFICYDLRFPEIFQQARLQTEADIMLVIANWPASRREHWMTLLKARAIETQSYVIGVNCVGTQNGLIYSGDSMAVDILGQVMGQLSGQEGVLVCDIPDEAAGLREKFPVYKDRRTDIY